MKKKSRRNIKTNWSSRSNLLKDKCVSLAHPVAKASYAWCIVSEQLCDILGPEIHHQWFKEVKPLVISHNVLLLEVPHHFSAQWIHTHYHELIDVLLSVIDKRLSSFFISQSERTRTAKGTGLLESAAAEKNSQSENQNGQ
jgi:chromosomal replication initiation ATPase DnaA